MKLAGGAHDERNHAFLPNAYIWWEKASAGVPEKETEIDRQTNRERLINGQR